MDVDFHAGHVQKVNVEIERLFQVQRLRRGCGRLRRQLQQAQLELQAIADERGRRIQELRTINEFAMAIGSSRSLEDLLDQVKSELRAAE